MARRKVNLESLLAGTADGACAIRDGLIVSWNAAAEKILGYAAKEAIGRPCGEIFKGRDAAGNWFCSEFCTVNDHVRRCEPMRHFEMRASTQTGDRIWLDISSVLLGSEGPATTVLHLFRDVTAAHDIDGLVWCAG